jgi:lipopolysaccharide/colanic/teichoic acid biosynthesis glycosyltransferase
MNTTPLLSSPAACRLRARCAVRVWHLKVHAPAATKRALDVTVTALALLPLLPLLALVALSIKLHDRGPVLFWQQRVGLDGRAFAFPKFRSMRVDAETVLQRIAADNHHGADAVTFKLRRDPRVTPIGRLIRRSSIDELPQLWCVLRGDMSLVGPRPPLVSEVARYTLADRARLTVKPGLTCIWQVNGRSDVPFARQVRMDIDYIHRQSVRTDLGLLLRTVPAVLFGRGAY